MVLDHVGVELDNPARDTACGCRARSRRRSTRRPPSTCEAVYRLLPSKHPAAAALARLVRRARLERRPRPGRRLRRAAHAVSACAPRRRRPAGALGRAAGRARRRARGDLAAARGSRPRARLFAELRRRRAAHRRSRRPAGPPASRSRRTTCATGDLAAAPARCRRGRRSPTSSVSAACHDGQHLHRTCSPTSASCITRSWSQPDGRSS